MEPNLNSASTAPKTFRIGFDIGGTFTDFVLLDEANDRVRLHKYLTTPDDPSVGALAGLGELVAAEGITLAQVAEIIHGTTLVTNAVIEQRGARLGLITTQGMRDILELGAEQRYEIYDLFLGFPKPLVARRLRLEVPERMSRDGRIVVPLDEAAVARAVETLAGEDIEALAICFLHSYRNPEHERRAAEIARRLKPGLAISTSAEVVPELREYPRTVTTCANAYVQPLVDRYLKRLERELWSRGFRGALRLMHSGGGLVSPETARALPIRLLESGPAGGALATAFFSALVGKPDVISFDMGGTTAKACLIRDGRADVAPMTEVARVHRFTKGSGLPIRAPVIDMIEIGAGGGSIAALDDVGLLRVGPRSAGADPGPACYGRGGVEPTVTDANLTLGYYDPEFFLGGRMRLDKAAAAHALTRVAAPLGLSAIEAAWGIHRLVTETMAAAARVHIIEKGQDPRRYAMVAFGGAGPAHAVEVARLLGVTHVIVPPASGAASALGFLAAPLSFETSRSHPLRLVAGFDDVAANAVLEALEHQSRHRLVEAGVAPTAVRVERSADMRLVGQMHEITVPLPDRPLDSGDLTTIRDAFAAVYTARYTSLYDGADIEAISFRVRCIGPAPRLALREDAQASAAGSFKGHRRAYFGAGFVDAPVHDRYALRAGSTIAGPAIIEETEATTVVPPGDVVTVDAVGNLHIAVAQTTRIADGIPSGESLEEACRRIEADPIALEIMWGRLVNITEEMWSTVVRTAFSLTICESQDFACELLGLDGEKLVHSPQAMPVFNLTLPTAVKGILAVYPRETLQPGDVLISNDPWLCAGHLFDVAIVTPIFQDGALVAFAASIGHVSDIGGTKESLRAREIYDEGLQIPPMKLYKAGEPNQDLIRLIAENVRKSDQVLGDLHALIAANARGADRLLHFMAEHEMRDLRAIGRVIQGRSERAMRDALQAFPDGIYESEVWCNPLGEPLRLGLKITVAGDTVALDYTDVPSQLPQGGLNVVMNYTSAYTTFPLKCILSPNVRGNAGDLRPLSVAAPEGSVLNCTKPAAVGIRHRLGWYAATCVLNALAQATPEHVKAYTGLPLVIYWYGKAADGAIYSDMMFSGGGEGATLRGDGKSGLIWPTSAANTSIELFEVRIPVLVLEKTFAADSGGPGRARGGLGSRIRFRKLDDDGLDMLAAIFPEGYGVAQPGLFGGRSGWTAQATVVDRDGTVVEDCGAGRIATIGSPTHVVDVQLAGGSGFGNPLERPIEQIEDDLLQGYITKEGAVRDYGIVLTADGRIDRQASARVRPPPAAARRQAMP
jgi:5-oxoprolinase (ATP-hydrolysing)/N-methylhydantoinase A